MSKFSIAREETEDLLLEIYTKERQAEFLLSNTVDEVDYTEAVRAVREIGLDPETVIHQKPF